MPRRRNRREPLAGSREAGAEEQPTPVAEQPAAAAAGVPSRAAEAEAPTPAATPEPGRASAGKATPAVADEKAQRSLYERVWLTGLPSVGAIAGRELGAYFVSPIGYVVAAVLVLPVSFLGYLARIGQGLPVTMDPIFGLIALLMVFFTPLYTMRLLAEERRTGTLEVLLTSPVRDWELVVGKWLGGFLFYLATIAFTIVYVVLLSIYTQTHYPATVLGLHLELPTVDYGRIVAGYVGVALVGAAWVSLGLLASSLTSNQIIAAVLGVGLLLAFQYLFGTLSTLLVSPYSDFFDYLNAANHAGSFSAGRLVPKDAIFFVTLTAGALFLTTRVVESRRWR
jgi:ABC-2 type transport system permease protein